MMQIRIRNQVSKSSKIINIKTSWKESESNLKLMVVAVIMYCQTQLKFSVLGFIRTLLGRSCTWTWAWE